MNALYVYGAGGHGTVVAEIADLLGLRVAGFVDDDCRLIGRGVLQWYVLGGKECVPGGGAVALGVGSNAARARLSDESARACWRLATLVHPSAAVSRAVVLGEGTVVMAQAAVNPRARIGRACILNTGCSVDHDCRVGDFVHIAPGVRIAGGVEIGESTLLGIGSCVRPNVRVGSGCVVGAGSVVLSDVPDGLTVVGNPARLGTPQSTKEGRSWALPQRR